MKSLIAQCSKIPIGDNKISQCCLEWVVNKLDLLQNESQLGHRVSENGENVI